MRKWQLAGYIDIFNFPWLKYGIDAPSTGKDILLQVNYNPVSSISMNIRYKMKQKEKNKTNKTVDILPYDQQRWRYLLNIKLNPRLNTKTQCDYNLYSQENNTTTGWSVSQAIGYKTTNSKFQCDLSLAYFNATDWNNRIYSYEKNILYVFNMPLYYGEGMRYYATLKWNICRMLNFYSKISSTHFFNKTTISSGLEEIDGREKTEINFLLKINF
jgi:hypothetical protein